jgi:AcrR family transcriptional regulator
MRTPYSFSVLRYVHDPVTQEFVNIGVAVYSGEAGFLRAMCTTHYARITRMFAKIDGNHFRQLTHYVQDKISEIGLSLPSALPFEPRLTIEHLLARVLPPDDSSVQFSHAGVGLTDDLEKTVAELFDRYVNRYASPAESRGRDDRQPGVDSRKRRGSLCGRV